MMKIKRQNKLGTYLAVTVGAGCAVSVAEASVTFYGVDSANDTNLDPAGISFGIRGGYFAVDAESDYDSVFLYNSGIGYFTRGDDLEASSVLGIAARYSFTTGGFSGGAGAVAGSNNYANISFNGTDSVYEAVAQFYFDGAGGGRLIAIATTNAVPDPTDLSMVGGAALSISDGKALIDAAAVPEPSSIALLALGSAGLLARRKRQVAA
ncbi:MAG: PEP-CTERM sorting domain-containing protein [Akkermansiaceae bacterium]